MDEITQAHARLLKDPSYQFHFPQAEAAAPPPAIPPATAFLHAGGALFWVVVVVLAVMLVGVAIQAIRGRGLPRVALAAQDAEQPGIGGPLPAAAVAVLGDADALAATGAYGAAVHALLLRGIGAIAQRYPRAMGPSLTSRDIAGLDVLPPALKAAFTTIAARAERSVFAQLALNREDWAACRAVYADLLGGQAG